LSDIWLFLEEDERTQFADILNSMCYWAYFNKSVNNYPDIAVTGDPNIQLIIQNGIPLDYYHFEEKELIIPHYEYESNIKGRLAQVKELVKTTIYKDSEFADKPGYADKIGINSAQVIDDLGESFDTIGITHGDQLENGSIKDIIDLADTTRRNIKRRLNSGDVNKNDLANIALSLTQEYSKSINSEEGTVKREGQLLMNQLTQDIRNKMSQFRRHDPLRAKMEQVIRRFQQTD